MPNEIRKDLARQEEYVEIIMNKYAMKLVTMEDWMSKTGRS
jgi:hypothetical protein